MKYRKKPVVIDAIKWDGLNVKEVMDFMAWRNASHDKRTGLLIHTLEGNLHANIGDMIIKGVQGEFYACKPDIFAATYEAVDASSPLPLQGGEQTDAMPELPEPCETALVRGLQGSEYRKLAKDYAPAYAQYSANQMRDYGLKCRRATLAAVSPQGREAKVVALEGWQPISTAPHDKPILAYCDHEADLGWDDDSKHLTLYAAHSEGMSHCDTGFHIVEWGGARDDATWEEPNAGSLPDWWFVAVSEFEVAANPTHWIPLPAAPGAAPIAQALPVAAEKDALTKAAGECELVKRTSDQSLTLQFSSCRAASAFEAAICATPPTWAQGSKP